MQVIDRNRGNNLYKTSIRTALGGRGRLMEVARGLLTLWWPGGLPLTSKIVWRWPE